MERNRRAGSILSTRDVHSDNVAWNEPAGQVLYRVKQPSLRRQDARLARSADAGEGPFSRFAMSSANLAPRTHRPGPARRGVRHSDASGVHRPMRAHPTDGHDSSGERRILPAARIEVERARDDDSLFNGDPRVSQRRVHSNGSSDVRSLPRRSHCVRRAPPSAAPDTSQFRRDAPSSRVPESSASRRRTSEKCAARRLTCDQVPPSTRLRPKVHRSKVLPTSVLPEKHVSKNEQFTNVQFTNPTRLWL